MATLSELISTQESTVSDGNLALMGHLAAIIHLGVLTGHRIDTIEGFESYFTVAVGQTFGDWIRAQRKAGDLLRQTQT